MVGGDDNSELSEIPSDLSNSSDYSKIMELSDTSSDSHKVNSSSNSTSTFASE